MTVTDDIAARIAAGELQPGARLLAERELAHRYGVAYGTIRRAMKELRGRGLISSVQGRGTFVARQDGPPPEPSRAAVLPPLTATLPITVAPRHPRRKLRSRPFRVRRSWRLLSAGLAYAEDVEGRGDLAAVSAACQQEVQQEPCLEGVDEPDADQPPAQQVLLGSGETVGGGQDAAGSGAPGTPSSPACTGSPAWDDLLQSRDRSGNHRATRDQDSVLITCKLLTPRHCPYCWSVTGLQ